MSTNIQNKEQEERRSLRNDFDDLFKFITDSNLTTSSSSMHTLLHAYDFDEEGREKLRNAGWTEDAIKKEYQSRKNECKWKIQGINDFDIMLGIEAFFQLTSTSSGCVHEALASDIVWFRELIFDTYIKQSYRTPEEKGQLIDKNLLMVLEKIFKEETLPAQILKYFGIADENKTYDIGGLEKAFELFAYRYKEVTKDFSCVNFLPPFRLLRTVRNIYAIHLDRSASQLNKDFVNFSKFYVANVIPALRFLIYFYVTLCTLINRAWHRVKNEENSLLKKNKPTMNSPQELKVLKNNRGSKTEEFYTYPPFSCEKQLFNDLKVEVNVKIVPLQGHCIESVSYQDNRIEVQTGNDGYVDLGNYTFWRTDKPEFRVKFNSMKDMQPFDVNLGTRDIWDGATIVFKESEGMSVEYDEGKTIQGINQMGLNFVDTQEKVTTDKTTAKESERIDNEIITEWSGSWQLKFRPCVSVAESDEDSDCVLDGIAEEGHNKCIDVPDYVYVMEQNRRFKVTSVSRSFWNQLNEMDTIFVALPENIKNADNVPDSVEVVAKINYSVNEEFCYKTKSGVAFKCKYIDNKGGIYDHCSIIGIDLEKSEETPEVIEVPKYANGLLVTEIGAKAFKDVKAQEILLPNSVKTIGEGAFAGSSIWRMRFPAGIREISAHMFENCENLQTFISDQAIMGLGEYAFAGCMSLGLVRFGCYIDSISPSLIISILDGQIPKGAFMNCCGLRNAYIDVKQIGTSAFEGCQNLTSIESFYGKNVDNDDFFLDVIGEGAFADCPSLTSLFGADSKKAFIASYERNPHRKKLVRVFESTQKDSLSEANRRVYVSFQKILLKTRNFGMFASIIVLIIYTLIIFLAGKCFGWW